MATEVADKSEGETGDAYGTPPVTGLCGFGELTDRGRLSMSLYGGALRRLYVDKLNFLPRELTNLETIYCRSTNMPRTLASMHNIINALYLPTNLPPGSARGPSVIPLIRTRYTWDEDLIQNWNCDRFRLLQDYWLRVATDSFNPSLAELDHKLSKYVGGKPIRLDGDPRASGILDTIKSARAEKIQVPIEFEDPKVMGTLEKAVIAEWFGGYMNQEIRTLGVGRAMANLQRTMARKIDSGDSDPLKMRIFTTHDSTLASLLISLAVFDGHWPDFSSSLTFELYKQKPPPAVSEPASDQDAAPPSLSEAGPSSHYVRARYENQSLAVPACAPASKHLPGRPEFCTFQAFSDIIKAITPTDWAKECRNLRKPRPDFARVPFMFEDALFPKP